MWTDITVSFLSLISRGVGPFQKGNTSIVLCILYTYSISATVALLYCTREKAGAGRRRRAVMVAGDWNDREISETRNTKYSLSLILLLYSLPGTVALLVSLRICASAHLRILY
jgi:hypothetical protein